jgi:hypothetical protein
LNSRSESEWDINRYYLGQGLQDAHGLVDQYLSLTEAYQANADAFDDASIPSAETSPSVGAEPPSPANMSPGDFRRLRNRLVNSALAFAEKDDRLKNNTSVVLLLEWRGRRLLFCG